MLAYMLYIYMLLSSLGVAVIVGSEFTACNDVARYAVSLYTIRHNDFCALNSLKKKDSSATCLIKNK